MVKKEGGSRSSHVPVYYAGEEIIHVSMGLQYFSLSSVSATRTQIRAEPKNQNDSESWRTVKLRLKDQIRSKSKTC